MWNQIHLSIVAGGGSDWVFQPLRIEPLVFVGGDVLTFYRGKSPLSNQFREYLLYIASLLSQLNQTTN